MIWNYRVIEHDRFFALDANSNIKAKHVVEQRVASVQKNCRRGGNVRKRDERGSGSVKTIFLALLCLLVYINNIYY